MARGDHPQRTPFYGAVLMFVAFVSFWPASEIPIVGLKAAAYALAAVVGVAGFVMTLRDYSGTKRNQP